MPGTIMLEGCLQLMAFYMMAMGLTIRRDGWRFEPVREETFELRCRGQVTPESKLLYCDLFVDDFLWMVPSRFYMPTCSAPSMA